MTTAKELRDSLVTSVVQGIQELTAERATLESGLKYAETTGRIETLRTMLTFLQSVDVDAETSTPAPKTPKAAKK